MTRGILKKVLYETRLLLAAFSVALFVVGMLLTMLLPQLEEGLNQFLTTLPFIRTFIQALLGDDFGGEVTSQTLKSIVWVHPTVLTLLWAHEIIHCTRFPAGEIDRGTIDILLSWPTSRRQLYLIESGVWLVGGLWLCLMLFAGHLTAGIFAATQKPHDFWKLFFVLSNLFCLYVAVGAVAMLISTASNSRGKAIGVVFALLLASFLLNFLIQFWPDIEPLGRLGVLSYYRPASIMATGLIPTWNLLSLLAIGSVAWLGGLFVVCRRSICTV